MITREDFNNGFMFHAFGKKMTPLVPMPVIPDPRKTPTYAINFGKLMASLCNLAEQLGFQYVFALLVLLTTLECLVILPSNCLVALFTRNVSHDVASGGHVPFSGLTLNHVDNGIEEVGFAMLAAEVLPELQSVKLMFLLALEYEVSYPADDIVMVGQMCLTVLAAVDLVGVQVYVVL